MSASGALDASWATQTAIEEATINLNMRIIFWSDSLFFVVLPEINGTHKIAIERLLTKQPPVKMTR